MKKINNLELSQINGDLPTWLPFIPTIYDVEKDEAANFKPRGI